MKAKNTKHTKPEYNRLYYIRNKSRIRKRNGLTWENVRLLGVWARNNRERKNAAQQIRRHGLSRSDFESLLKRQKHCCAICQKPFKRRPCIDHDHQTKKIRGLLCNNCNVHLYFFDRPHLFRCVMSYLGRACEGY